MENISFRPFTDNDLDKMYNWLLKDFVHEWFANGCNITMDFVKRVFGGESETLKKWIIQIDDKDIGYIQSYYYSDDDGISNKYKKEIGSDDGSMSFDFFIGEENFIHKGYGKHIIKNFLDNIAFKDPRCTNLIVGPRTKNTASIKTLEKNGFKYYKDTIDDKGRDEYMMILHKYLNINNEFSPENTLTLSGL